MNPECSTPCRSARALVELIFLLFILEAHFLLQFFFPDSLVGFGLPESLSEADWRASSPSEVRRLFGLIGRGEKVPWSQGPSCARSRTSSMPLSRAVDSVGKDWRLDVLGPATGAPSLESSSSWINRDRLELLLPEADGGV